MKKRATFYIIALALLLNILTSCNNNGEGPNVTNNDEKATVTFTMLYAGNYDPSYKSLIKMKELTNVVLDITAIPDSDYDIRAQLFISTGIDMPDIISKVKPLPSQALSGVLLPISDYYDQMPNFMAFIEKNNLQHLIENARQADGKVYELPVNTKEVKTSSKQIFIREDVFYENDLPIPKTYDDLYLAARRLKEVYPDSSPIQVVYGNGNLLDMVSPSFGTSAGWNGGVDGFHYLVETDEWIFAPTSDEYKVMLEYLHKLYSEGLLNQHYTTYSVDTYSMNAYSNKTFVLMSEWFGCEVPYNITLREAGYRSANWIPIYPLEGPAGTYLSRVSNSTQTTVISASVAKKGYFDKLIKWLDWMYTDEAADLFSWGIEGETYIIDNRGNKTFTPDVDVPSNPNGTIDLQKVYGVNNNNLTFVYPYDEELARMVDIYKELIELEEINDAIPDMEPSIPLTEEDIDIQIVYSANLNGYVDQMTMKFIMGGESLDNWDNYVSECKKKGSDRLLELYNDAWKRK